MRRIGKANRAFEMPLEQMYRMARALRIADGADEVQKQTVARELLSDVKPVELPSQHLGALRQRAAGLFGERVAAIRADHGRGGALNE